MAARFLRVRLKGISALRERLVPTTVAYYLFSEMGEMVDDVRVATSFAEMTSRRAPGRYYVYRHVMIRATGVEDRFMASIRIMSTLLLLLQLHHEVTRTNHVTIRIIYEVIMTRWSSEESSLCVVDLIDSPTGKRQRNTEYEIRNTGAHNSSMCSCIYNFPRYDYVSTTQIKHPPTEPPHPSGTWPTTNLNPLQRSRLHLMS